MIRITRGGRTRQSTAARLAALGLLLSLALLLGRPASLTAQEAPAWKSDWRVYCTWLHSLTLAQFAQTIDKLLADVLPDEGAEWIVDWLCSDRNPNSPAGFARTEFRAATRWLRVAGFPAPIVESAPRDEKKYVAWIDNTRFRLRERGSGRVVVDPNGVYFANGEIYVSPPMVRLRKAVEPHELFHGNQNAAAPGKWMTELRDVWVWEGTARAVDMAWGAKPNTPADTRRSDSRYFDDPLNWIADLDTKGPAYATSIFWLDVGRQLRSTDKIGYLPAVLTSIAHEQSLWGSLKAVDETLEELFKLRGFTDGGLYRAFPEFVRFALNDPAKAADHFRFVRSIPLTLFPGQSWVRAQQTNTIEAVAANAYKVRVNVPAGTLAGLRIDFEDDNAHLHLIVDDRRYNRFPTAHRPNRRRNTFLTAVQGTGRDTTFYVRVVNVAKPAVSMTDGVYTLNFALTELERCDPAMMMAAVHPRARERLMTVGLAGLPGPLATPVRALLPPDRYESEFEAIPGLHPAPASMSISGLVSDGGVACTEPLGTNPLLGLQMGEQGAGDRLREAMEGMMRLSPEKLMEAMRSVSPDSSFTVTEQLFPGVQGERVRQPIGFIMESLGRDGDALFSVHSPNGVAWQLGPSFHTDAVGPGSWGMLLKHGGAGGWRSNAGSGLTIRLPGVPASQLKEGATYPAELVTVMTSIGTPIYSRWSGTEFTVTCEGVPHDLFEGWLERVTAQSMRGEVTITRFTGAAVEGTFVLSGTAQVGREEYVRTSGGGCTSTRSSGPEVRTGTLSVEGTFVAPTVVATQRHGRAVALTYAEQPDEEDNADIMPLPAVYPPAEDDVEDDFWCARSPAHAAICICALYLQIRVLTQGEAAFTDCICDLLPELSFCKPDEPVDCVVGDRIVTVLEDWHVVAVEGGERVERRTVRVEWEVLVEPRNGGKDCPGETRTEERRVPDTEPVDCVAGDSIVTVLEDWHVVAVGGGERVERRTVRVEWEVLVEPRNGGKDCLGETRTEERRVPDTEPVDCVVGDSIVTVLDDWRVVAVEGGERVERRTVRVEWEVLVEPRNGGKDCPGETRIEERPVSAGVPGGDEPPGGARDRPDAPRRPPGAGGGDGGWLGQLWLAFEEIPDADLRSVPQPVTGVSPPQGGGIRVRDDAHRIRISLSPEEVVECRIPGVLGSMFASGQLLTASVELSLSAAYDSVQVALEDRGGQGDLRFTAGGTAGGQVSVRAETVDRLQIAVSGARFDFSGQDPCPGVGDFVATVMRNP